MPAPRYILLDRDGTLIVERHYLSNPDDVELTPGAGEGLRLLRDAGCRFILITNQSGVGRGMFPKEDVDRVHVRLVELLEAEGVHLDGIFYCPHAPEAGCDCRKPKTGLVRQAEETLSVELKGPDCVMIGDKPADVELGRAINARTILVRSGYGTKAEQNGECEPEFIADDLLDAARTLLGSS